MKNLVKEAQEVSAHETNEYIKNELTKTFRPSTDKRKDNETKNLITNNDTINEKVLLKSVESLVSAIKSGKLIKEQELSDNRIKSILNRVIERKEIGKFAL